MKETLNKVMLTVLLLGFTFAAVGFNGVQANDVELCDNEAQYKIKDLELKLSLEQQARLTERKEANTNLITIMNEFIILPKGLNYAIVPENFTIVPVIIKRGGSGTTTITNTEYIQCDQCADRPSCTPYYFKYVDDGTDECGCAINPRCVEDNHMEIAPSPKEI